ncbi:MAG: hypothetical protein AAF614_16810 [Chloroflexota bacterium]
MQKKGQILIVGLALIGLLIALWPNASSLYDLTGEEEWDGQLIGLIHWLNTAVRPQPQLAHDATFNHQADSLFGVNTFLQQEVELEKREQSMQMLSEAGFRYIRQEFTWEDIEVHGKGDFLDRRNEDVIGVVDAWEKYDNIVDLAEKYDVEIIARLSNPPSWTRAEPDEVIGSNAPPDDFQDYADFVTAVTERYNGRIRYVQLWNEPNIYPEWGEQNVDPEAFTKLLCTGYEAAKTVNPDIIVLAGAMSPTIALSGRDANDLVFMQRMYNAGAGDCFDIASAQGYGLWSGAADQRLRPTVINYPHHMLIRDLMVQNGDAYKPIWISEMAWNVVPDGIAPLYGQVTEEQQARYGVEAYQRAAADWPWIGNVNYWFFKRPADFEKDQAWYYFRLLEPDFTPLPAFEAVADYANSDVAVEKTPDWVYGWDANRPFLFMVSSAILFFMLLRYLTHSFAQVEER